MRFTNGNWLWREGVTPHLAARLLKYTYEPGALTLHVADQASPHSRLEAVVLKIRVTSPLPGVLRVQATHFARTGRGKVVFPLNYDLQADGTELTETDEALTFASGPIRLRVSKTTPFQMFFEDGAGKPLTGPASGQIGLMALRGESSHLMQKLSLGVNEQIYGLGERFGPLVRNGQDVEIWNEDGGTSSELSYKNIPFYLSSRGYGLFVNSPGKVDFAIGTERVASVQFSLPGEELDYYVLGGPTPKDVLTQYTALSGRAPALPAWSYGLWLTTSFMTEYNEKIVSEQIEGMFERDIPLGVFHFDCFWMKERQWVDFAWDEKAFPEPAAMLARLKARGLKICVWINPYVSGLSAMFDEGAAGGYFLKRADGSPFQIDLWQPGMAIVDFTNPDAVQWYNGKLRALLDMGVDCFKTDFGERIPTDVVYHDASDPQLMHNYYAYLYNEAVFKLLEEERGAGGAVLFARAATACSQKFPVHWGGDCWATFESMAEDLRGGLSFLLSGGGYWSHDIGGFEGTATPALYKRWVALGLFSSHSRLHGSSSYRVPWLFGDEAVDVLRFFTKLRHRLMPYLAGAAAEVTALGWPMMRPMVLEYPDDPACRYLDRQYLLGGSLLVAPVFSEDSRAEYYLPHGRWTDFWTGAVQEGGRWYTETVGFLRIPLFVRENTLLPMGATENTPDYDYQSGLTLHAFGLADGATATARIPGASGRPTAVVTARREGDTITLTTDTPLPGAQVVVRGEGKASPVPWDDAAAPLRLGAGV